MLTYTAEDYLGAAQAPAPADDNVTPTEQLEPSGDKIPDANLGTDKPVNSDGVVSDAEITGVGVTSSGLLASDENPSDDLQGGDGVIATLDETQNNIDQIQTSVEQNNDAIASLRNLTTEQYTPAVAYWVQKSITNPLAIMGVKDDPFMTTLESDKFMGQSKDQVVLTLEALNLTLEASLVSGVTKIFVNVKEGISKITKGVGALQARAGDIQEKAKGITSTSPSKAKMSINNAHRVSYKGKVDVASQIEGLKRTSAMIDWIIKVYIPNAKAAVDNTIKGASDKAKVWYSQTGAPIAQVSRAAEGAEDFMKTLEPILLKMVDSDKMGEISGARELKVTKTDKVFWAGLFKEGLRLKDTPQGTVKAGAEIPTPTKEQIVALAGATLELTKKLQELSDAAGSFFNAMGTSMQKYQELDRRYVGIFKRLFVTGTKNDRGFLSMAIISKFASPIYDMTSYGYDVARAAAKIGDEALALYK